jgi:hypothetical protein
MKLKSNVEKKDNRVIQTFVIRPSGSGTPGNQEGTSRSPVTRGGLPVNEDIIQSKPASFKGSRIAGRHGG